MSALLIAIFALAVSILLVIITLALSEAAEDTHHLVRRMTWKARLASPGLAAPELEGDQADDKGQAVGLSAVDIRDLERLMSRSKNGARSKNGGVGKALAPYCVRM